MRSTMGEEKEQDRSANQSQELSGVSTENHGQHTRALAERIVSDHNDALALAALVAALKEILNSGVEFEDERMDYVVMQVDKLVLAAARAAIALVETRLKNPY